MGRVVEVPEFPTVRVVTRAAIAPQPSVVNVVPRVTPGTIAGRVGESLGRVALRAGHDHMETRQEVTRLVVVETHLRPVGGVVTLIALASKTASMRLVGSMAIDAVASQLLVTNRGRVTGVTVELAVRIIEPESEAPGVIELRHLPGIVSVAVGTLRSEPPGVAVVRPVASGAILGNRLLRIAAPMAIPTANPGVLAEEGKAGFARVVESLRSPVGRGMTACALRSLAALVNVIGHVTAGALLRCAFVLLPGMAGGTRDLRVPVRQREAGFMIEAGMRP